MTRAAYGVVLVAGLGCFAIAAADLLGLAQHHPQLVADTAGRVRMHGASALLFALAATSLVPLWHGAVRVPLLIAAVIVAVCGVSLAQAFAARPDRDLAEALLGAWNAPGAAIPANLSITLAAAGIALGCLSISRTEWVADVVAACCATIAVFSLRDHAAGLESAILASSIRTLPAFSSAALLLLSIGILGLRVAREQRRGRGVVGALALPVGVLVASVSMVVAFALHDHEVVRALDRRWSRSVAIDEGVNLQTRSWLAALRRLARRWPVESSRTAWEIEAGEHLRELHGLQSVAIVRDRDSRPEVIARASVDPADPLAVGLLSGHWPPPDGEVVRPMEGDGDSRPSLIVMLPIPGEAAQRDVLRAEIDLAAMLQSVFERVPTQEGISLAFHGRELELGRPRPSAAATVVALELQSPLDGWVLTTGPTTADTEVRSSAPALVASGGLLVGLLIAVTLAAADRHRTSLRRLTEVDRRLLESEERHQLAIAGSKDTIWDFDVRTGNAFFSDRINEVLGYEPGELRQGFAAFVEHLHPDDRADVQAALDAHLRDHVPYDDEFRLRTKTGGYCWLRSRGQAIWDSDGRPVRMAGSLTWIDDRKAAEIELEQARDAALDGARAKSEFLAVMSHEIRTPLNGIIGAAALLVDEPMTDEGRQLASLVLSSSSSLLVVINDILDLSKIEAGRLEIEHTEFAIHEVMATLVELLGQAARAKGIELRVHVDDGLPRCVIGDPVRIRQVLLNFAGNAVKFTERGSVTLGARLEQRGGTALRVRFSVEDTGIGLSAEAVARLFQPFAQADSSTTRKFGGTGLGLAISRRLAELMEGTVGVESVLGTGSTFWLEVPVQSVAHPAARGASAEAVPAGVEGASSHAAGVRLRGRVLVAEDNLANQKIIEVQLKRMGVECEIAGDGQAAVDAVRRSRFDLVLMDCQMPGMDGFAATCAIRRLGGGAAATPIVALTADALDGDRERCIEAGMNDYLAKPVKFTTLERVVAHWLSAGEEAA